MAPTRGAGITPKTSSVTTDAAGVAALKVTANTVAGSYQVTARVSGVAAIVSFSLTNNPAS